LRDLLSNVTLIKSETITERAWITLGFGPDPDTQVLNREMPISSFVEIDDGTVRLSAKL